ncbi:MAG: signal peptide peptidase SppA [Lentimicrobiaceae bacterium]|jgi:protease IV|nr:signal peptide peptidase SppA [Lentimicrobiaceae bacterium]MDG1901751.1 signal peptide peptidase SppA [Bacteroidales bacterium]MDG2081327.1 signal peptide peptidase SppA [Bacteroidales bacterium]
MKQFFKLMFASFVGTLLTIFVVVLLFAGAITSIVAMSGDDETSVKDNSILHISWNAEIKDQGNDNPFEGFDFATMQSKKPVGLYSILNNIDKASKDKRIDGIFLDMETLPAGMATSEEIRNKLIEFKKSGKFIISYANGYDQKAYYLASLADEIYLNKEGMILFKGLQAQLMFFKNLLDKLDIDMQIVRGPDNKYKSAVEPLMREHVSKANREQLQTLLNSMWGKLLVAISESRDISIDDLNKIADKLEVTDANKALELGFIDGAIYRDELIDILKEKTGVEKDDKLKTVSFANYTNAKVKSKKELGRDKIAIVFAEGSIVQGKSDGTNIGSVTTSKALRKAHKNDRVKAIVFRINSGGGDALASEIIRREVELAMEKMPVIVSMGNVAASGGYWIATNADYIFAQPTTVTGSIGVFGVIPNLGDMMNKKLGITMDNIMTNENSDFIDMFAPLKPYQKEKLDQEISKIYTNFTELVAETRDLDVSYVDSIARGRVWSGVDALKIGLIDGYGGLEDAVAYAAEKAELDDNYRISTYPKKKDFIEQLVAEITGQASQSIVKKELGEYYKFYENIHTVKNMKGVQARLPYFMEIN